MGGNFGNSMRSLFEIYFTRFKAVVIMGKMLFRIETLTKQFDVFF